MTVAIIKTKAEQALAADFAAKVRALPGTAATATERVEAMAAFERGGLPHRRIEAWKYTDLRAMLKQFAPIANEDQEPVASATLDAALGGLAAIDADRMVFVNGRHRKDLSASAPQVNLFTLGEVLASGGALASLTTDEAVVSLNGALATDGAVIDVAEGVTLVKPIMIVMIAAGSGACLTALRHTIKLGASAVATVIEAHVTLDGATGSQSNSVLEVSIGDNARLTHILLGLEGPASTHIETIAATLGSFSTFKSFQLTASTGLARNQAFVRFGGENSKLDISGLMLARGREHIDTTLVIDHAVPNCESRELFKTVLDDAARGVFQGKVIVRPHAQKTDGKQMAKALMLSEACEFDSKPELEIYADDVVCGHGATVAEIDPAMMFYLRSRGIPKDEARAMLIESFVGEALEQVDDEALREKLSEIARDWLSKGHA